VSYEEGSKAWGKDFGAYETTGMALYQCRAVRLRDFEPGGRAIEIAPDLDSVLLGTPNMHVDQPGVQKNSQNLDPDPNNAKNRGPDQGAANRLAAKNTLPRSTIDKSGRVWLAFRSAHPIWVDDARHGVA
jgi:hypothetical protein